MMLNNTLNELDLASVLGVEGDTGLEKKLGASTETSSYMSEGEILNEEDSEGMRLRCLDLLKNIPSDDSLFSDTEIFGTKQEVGEEVKQEKRPKKEKEPKPKKIKKSNPVGVKEIEAIQSPTHSDTFWMISNSCIGHASMDKWQLCLQFWKDPHQKYLTSLS